MIRTLTVVACFTLLAGLAMGFFVAQAKSAGDRVAARSGHDPALDRKLAFYADYYRLTPEETGRVRSTLKEYDQRLQDLLRQLRARHQEEFRSLAERADGQIREVLGDRMR